MCDSNFDQGDFYVRLAKVLNELDLQLDLLDDEADNEMCSTHYDIFNTVLNQAFWKALHNAIESSATCVLKHAGQDALNDLLRQKMDRFIDSGGEIFTIEK